MRLINYCESKFIKEKYIGMFGDYQSIIQNVPYARFQIIPPPSQSAPLQTPSPHSSPLINLCYNLLTGITESRKGELHKCQVLNSTKKMMNMELTKEQSTDIAHDYTLARICGFTKSFDEFSEAYSKYFDEAYGKLYSSAPATAEATENPFRHH